MCVFVLCVCFGMYGCRGCGASHPGRNVQVLLELVQLKTTQVLMFSIQPDFFIPLVRYINTSLELCHIVKKNILICHIVTYRPVSHVTLATCLCVMKPGGGSDEPLPYRSFEACFVVKMLIIAAVTWRVQVELGSGT
jgi:hypothetical protein